MTGVVDLMKPGNVPRPGDNVHIPLPEAEALRLMLKVKPTADMPRPGKHRSKSTAAEMAEEFGQIQPDRPLKKAIKPPINADGRR